MAPARRVGGTASARSGSSAKTRQSSTGAMGRAALGGTRQALMASAVVVHRDYRAQRTGNTPRPGYLSTLVSRMTIQHKLTRTAWHPTACAVSAESRLDGGWSADEPRMGGRYSRRAFLDTYARLRLTWIYLAGASYTDGCEMAAPWTVRRARAEPDSARRRGAARPVRGALLAGERQGDQARFCGACRDRRRRGAPAAWIWSRASG